MADVAVISGTGNRFKDFDDAIDEEANEAITIRVAGREYVLPPSLPAGVVLTQLRNITDDGTIPTKAVPAWMESLVGRENLDQMLDDGITWKKLESLTSYLLTEYGIVASAQATSDGDDSEGN